MRVLICKRSILKICEHLNGSCDAFHANETITGDRSMDRTDANLFMTLAGFEKNHCLQNGSVALSALLQHLHRIVEQYRHIQTRFSRPRYAL